MEILATTRDDAIAAAQTIAGSVALKIVSADIQHKSDIGGVELSLTGDDAIGEAFDRIIRKSRTAHPEATLDGVLVSEMVSNGVEAILGVQNDPLFGPVIIFGLGGVFAEIIHDVSLRLAPFDEEPAHQMIREINGFSILAGARGTAAVDLNALATSLSHLSIFAAANADTIESIDINPLRIRTTGIIALDALIITRP